MSLAATNQGNIMNAGMSERKLLSTYEISLPNPEYDSCKKSERCVAATQTLSKFHPIVLNEHSPLSTAGDGNCLYRAVSLAFFGTEELHGHLRLLASLEIIENRSHYDTAHRKYVDLICDNRIVSSDYMSLVQNTCKIGSYAEMLHIYALSAVLNETVKSYYPPTVAHIYYQHHSTGSSMAVMSQLRKVA